MLPEEESKLWYSNSYGCLNLWLPSNRQIINCSYLVNSKLSPIMIGLLGQSNHLIKIFEINCCTDNDLNILKYSSTRYKNILDYRKIFSQFWMTQKQSHLDNHFTVSVVNILDRFCVWYNFIVKEISLNFLLILIFCFSSNQVAPVYSIFLTA